MYCIVVFCPGGKTCWGSIYICQIVYKVEDYYQIFRKKDIEQHQKEQFYDTSIDIICLKLSEVLFYKNVLV